jgi:hypothetical protein
MDKSQKIVLVVGLIIAVALIFFNIYIGLIALVILATLVMSFRIMNDSVQAPEIVAFLNEDAKSLVIKNVGNAAAHSIHVSVVPHNIEYDIASLEADTRNIHPFETMISEAKAVVRYKNQKGNEYSRSIHLSALGGDEDDILKPVFPLFKWKQE